MNDRTNVDETFTKPRLACVMKIGHYLETELLDIFATK